jgi:DnaJ-class molecular chaperone
MADEGRDGTAAALLVELVQEPHAHFQRAGDHLLQAVHLPLVDALAGCEISLRAIDSRVAPKRTQSESPLVLSTIRQAGHVDTIKPGEVWVLRHQGMPTEADPSRRGHLYVRVVVDFPKQVAVSVSAVSDPSASTTATTVRTKSELERILGQQSRSIDVGGNRESRGGISGMFQSMFSQGRGEEGRRDLIFAERASEAEVRQLDKMWGGRLSGSGME